MARKSRRLRSTWACPQEPVRPEEAARPACGPQERSESAAGGPHEPRLGSPEGPCQARPVDFFAEATRAWFGSTFEAPTPVQTRGWASIADGDHALLIAPTGSGKTLAAFLWGIDRLTRRPPAEPNEAQGYRVVYVSPLKALVYDVERNLRSPIAGIERTARLQGREVRLPRVDVRTGDTTAKERRDHLRHPGEILVTTPESLYLLLGSQARENLRHVDTVIVDEVHALAPTKRGAHLALSLERLALLTGSDPQRIGLSATARPTAEVARFLGGDRPVTVVDTASPPSIDLRIVVPVGDMTRPEETEAIPPEEPPPGAEEPTGGSERGIWPTVYPRLLDLIREHHTSILFVNSRGLCERLCRRLNDLAGEELARSHHGSVSHGERKRIEEMLKAGDIKAIVATSSLELGIDMGAVDLVVLIESPGSVASGLQRVGRAGHGVGETSKGRLFPKHRGDLLEAAVVSRRMAQGEIETLRVPSNPLDVLAQQVVAAVATDPMSVDQVGTLARRAANFRDLPNDALTAVLDMLAGRYPSHAFTELRPRLVWDRDTDQLTARRGSKMVSLVNGGTIPDRGTYGVYMGDDGPRLGELDEEMVHETVAGQTVTLGATTWRVERITRDRVIVVPAPGETGKLPFWRGEGPGRPIELGRAMGAFLRELEGQKEPEAWLQAEFPLDPLAAQNLAAYVAEQRGATGALPTDRAVVIERFRDELGDWRVCILTPFGARVHAPWALALEARLTAETGYEIQTLWSDDGIVLRFGDAEEVPNEDLFLPDPEELDELLLEQLPQSALFAGQFRENAARSLLMPRRRPGARTPLWIQRLKSAELLAVARQFPSFPVIIETYRACLQDVFDVPALSSLLTDIRARKIRVRSVETPSASPFARSLVFDYVGVYLYEDDAPLAERKAQALSLDRRLLRELLGEEELRELLDTEVMDQVEQELQHLEPERFVRDEDGVHDLLRRLGDLTQAELARRCEGDAGALAQNLIDRRRAVRLLVAGEPRLIAVEDVGLFRDALGCSPPPGLPEVFLDPVDDPLEILLARWASRHAPFPADRPAVRYGLAAGQIVPALRQLVGKDRLLRGEFRPGHTGEEYCDPEILRRIKRRTLARLRNEVAPVDASLLGRFLPAWHGVGERGSGLTRLQEIVVQLEGLPLSYGELESVILPARMRDFTPAMLDELGAMGWVVWVGHGSLGARDGKVALYRRERVGFLVDPPTQPEDLEDLHRGILAHLRERGASFFADLRVALRGSREEELHDALWDLVWAGLVTNDTFAPLRAAGASRPGGAKQRIRAQVRAVAGRWALVDDLLLGAPSETERAHARAIKLLERHGIVTREVGVLEALPGGFSAVYPVLRAMEDGGKIRRGYFVEGLGGAQFAFPGAVDRLRGFRHDEPQRDVQTVAATDPANPYGWILPWPTRDETQPSPKRVAGASVVLVDGVATLYVPPRGKNLITFPAADDPEILAAAGGALVAIAARRRGKSLRIETVDGEPAGSSRHADPLRQIGFRAGYRGLELEA